MFIYCLVQPAWYIWGCLCVQACFVGWGMEPGETSSLACAPNALADQGEKKERFLSKTCSLKAGLFSTDLQARVPGKATITLPLNEHAHTQLHKNGHYDKSQWKRWEGKKWGTPVSSAFWIPCHHHQPFAHSQLCCLPWQATSSCGCWGLSAIPERRDWFGKCEFRCEVSGEGAQKQG